MLHIDIDGDLAHIIEAILQHDPLAAYVIRERGGDNVLRIEMRNSPAMNHLMNDRRRDSAAMMRRSQDVYLAWCSIIS